jgi:hypothetical protein
VQIGDTPFRARNVRELVQLEDLRHALWLAACIT